MRFAEKMLLNATFYSLAPGARHDYFGNRCALGLVEEDVDERELKARSFAEKLYPWLDEVEVPYPCACRKRTHPFGYFVNTIIAQMFNEHVMGDHTWTLERLADWIDSVDPTPRTPAVEPVESIELCDGKMLCK